MKKFIGLFIIVIIITFIFTDPSAFAQGGVPIGPGDGDGVEAPLGFLEVLAAAGGGYAIKKLHDRKKE